MEVPAIEYLKAPGQEYLNWDAVMFQEETSLTGFRM
jgi:hypothetical protein